MSDPADPEKGFQSRARANAVHEDPRAKTGPGRAVHVTMMGPGIDKAHSQMTGPKSMSQVLSEHVLKKGADREKVAKHVRKNTKQTNSALNFLDKHQGKMGLLGKDAQKGFEQLKGARGALNSGNELRSALSPFFDKPGTEGTDEQREQVGAAMKSMMGSLKQFGPDNHMEIANRTKVVPETGEVIGDSPQARAMQNFVQGLIDDPNQLKGLGAAQGQNKNSKPMDVAFKQNKDGSSQLSVNMQGPQGDPMKNLGNLMNLGGAMSNAMNGSGKGSPSISPQMQKAVQGQNTMFNMAQKMGNMFGGGNKAKSPAMKVNIQIPKPKK